MGVYGEDKCVIVTDASCMAINKNQGFLCQAGEQVTNIVTTPSLLANLQAPSVGETWRDITKRNDAWQFNSHFDHVSIWFSVRVSC